MDQITVLLKYPSEAATIKIENSVRRQEVEKKKKKQNIPGFGKLRELFVQVVG